MKAATTLLHLRVLLALALLVGAASGVAAQGGGAAPRRRQRVVDVGVILDRTTWVGNMSWTCMELAVEDFYADAGQAGHGTRLKLHLRDTGPDAVDAAAAGVDLLKNVGVQAIVGPQTSTQAKFLARLGNKSSVPIISFSADCPSRSGLTPYFIRTAWNDSSQAEAIASLVQKHNWREVVPVFEDDDTNTKFIPDLVDALKRVDARVSYRCKIHPSATEDAMKAAISNLGHSWTSVFVVRMSHALALKFFQLAKEEGMMGQGFVWITAYGLTDIFDVVGSPALDVMQGVLGVKPHVQDTVKLQNFSQRWHSKYRLENPGTSLSEPTVSGLYAYDTIWALASAAEKAGYANRDFRPSVTKSGSTDFDRIDTSKAAEKLRGALLKVNFSGMSGNFRIENTQLVSSIYTIINIVGQERREVGFWTPEFGISSSLNMKSNINIIWPGDNKTVPRGWLLPRNKILTIGVPANPGFGQFVRYKDGPEGKKGFCIEVFDEVVANLPYEVPYTYRGFDDGQGNSNGTYDELIYKLYRKEFDAVIGTGAFVVFTGFVVWCVENHEDFNGTPANQIGSVFYFSFSTLVFAHREKIKNNLSRIVVVVWLFVVLIVQQSYTASLSSILTVEQLQPTVTNLDEVIRKGSHVGYLNDSFLPGLLKSLKINESKMIPLNSVEEYNDALSTRKVAVIVDEIPYLKLFLSKYCHNYTMTGPIYRFDGFGYAFPRGSPLTPDITRGILNLSSSGRMAELQKELYGDKSCPDKDDSQTSSNLTLHSFQGLFGISGACSILALILHALITNKGVFSRWLAIWSKLSHKSNTPQIVMRPVANVGSTGSPPEGQGSRV
ncbi:Glutamate receptor 2.7 [Hordeum vulgare]|nr:Glutamate receptor 2.7 [Hordeum vulgare]